MKTQQIRYTVDSQVVKISNKFREILQNPEKLPENKKLIHTWSFKNQPPHAGQLFDERVLPDGRIKRRLVTFFCRRK